ncbi:7-cyano-7-deazaguanine synthase QueC, partial [Candidatus Margulisiibacteriota bacterium]
MSKAIVLLSGGQDSATCLAIAINDFPDQVEAITFNYKQRHKIEIKSAIKLASIAKVPHKIINLPSLSELTSNALTRKDIKIEHQKGALPSSFVPGRNHIFLSYAAIYAYEKKIKHIYSGVCQTDFSGYPDCRQDFISSLEKTL